MLRFFLSSLLRRDGSKSCHRSWHLNCLDSSSTLSSDVLKRYTRNWNSHKSFTWTGELCTDNTIKDVHVNSVSHVPVQNVCTINAERKKKQGCLFKSYTYWSIFFCGQISSQKHRTDSWEERRSEKTQGATCSPSAETRVVSYPSKLRYGFKTPLHGNRSSIKRFLRLFPAIKTTAQDLPSILWLTCCSLCWSLLPPSLQVFLQLKIWDQLHLHRLLQATPSANASPKTTGWVHRQGSGSGSKTKAQWNVVYRCLLAQHQQSETVNNMLFTHHLVSFHFWAVDPDDFHWKKSFLWY